MFERRLFFHVDWALLTAILLLAGIGVAMIYSTTYVMLPSGGGHAGAQVRTQLYALAIGLVALMLCMYFGESRRGARNSSDLLIGGLFMLLPLMLIAKQPDLGTAITLLP